MDAKLTFKYDRAADILYINKCPPYAEQESEKLGDEVVARLNPTTGPQRRDGTEMNQPTRPQTHQATSAVAFVTTLAFLIILGGCALSERAAGTKDTRPVGLPKMTLDCIFIRSIDDWKELDGYNLIIYAPTRAHAYHIELDTYCQSLHLADHIGISSHQDGRLCSYGGDAILVRGQRCPIGAIRPYKSGGDLSR